MAKFDFSDPFLIFVENVTDTDSPLREKFRNVETFQIRGKIDPKVLSGEKLCADMENIVQWDIHQGLGKYVKNVFGMFL